ncbi:MAG: hypothetical protein JNJ99_03075 [Crocinitomicaceae bacterium]|nr:hypothetical protein [Crocinitomicaceae bacterium]
MKKSIFIFLLSSVLLFFGTENLSVAQSAYADSLMKASMKRLEKIPKYVCDIKILLDVEWINIKERTGKAYFYPPDSVNYEIKGFAFLPKKGYNDQLNSVTEGDYTALLLNKETISGVSCEVIKIIPSDIESDVVLGQFWIDGNLLIRKMTFVTRDEGTFNLFLDYGTEKYAVPKKVTVVFDIKNQELPATMTGDLESAGDEKPKGEKSKGKIEIYYSNYIFG